MRIWRFNQREAIERRIPLGLLCCLLWLPGTGWCEPAPAAGGALVLASPELAPAGNQSRTLRLEGLFFETSQGRTFLPADLLGRLHPQAGSQQVETKLTDGRLVKISLIASNQNFDLQLSAQPEADILKWGLGIEAGPEEYFTGLMERVVDGPQQASWKPGLEAAMNLRGQKVDMLLKPTTSVYAPYYLSSRGYALFVRGNWPGVFDFCAADPARVKLEWEGPSLALKVYTASTPAALVSQHALEAGPPFLPPKWSYSPWRWRDEHKHRTNYYDGTLVTGPFNSDMMEDVLLMKAFDIPCGAYWIDRPWGPGPLGCDDFEIDPQRLPNFADSVKWLEGQGTKMVLWIGPFFQGRMATNALAQGYNLPGQKPARNNYPLVDLTNPKARLYWQEGVAQLLKLGVAGFKLDRSEEGIPDDGPFKVFDGRSLRENRNAYPPMYLQATYDITRQYRSNDFVLMPRAAYTGSSPYGVFWGGDIGGTQEGLRASLIAVQRAAVMGYPNWGSDTCGYRQQLLEQEVCARWLAFSCFTPIMEVGPTRNVGFWNLPRQPEYDTELIAVWRLYARLHERLADYSYACARQATQSGLPIVRPLFLVEPQAPQAWTNWWTYQYGADLLVSPIWQKGQRTQTVYLPSGQQWRDAWHPEKSYRGGQTVTVQAELHQMPLFVREGARLELGDLQREYAEGKAIAARKPDLKTLDAEANAWFAKQRAAK